MTESGMSDQPAEAPDVHSFGERLFAARTRRGLSAAEVAKSVNLTVDIVEAIERSDIARLPQPTFVQGYIRVIARQVGVPEDIVLEEYSRAVPHVRESVLRPRSVLPDETNSSSPFVRTVSMLVLLAVVLAAVYAMVSYYSEMADIMAPESELTDSDSLEIPYRNYVPEENETLNAVDEQYSGYSSPETVIDLEPIESNVRPEKIQENVKALDVMQDSDVETRTSGQDTGRAVMIETQGVAPGEDALELYAEESSWVEVVDANDMRLRYDLVQSGKTVTLRGTAPFDIFLGNAPAMTVQVNGVQVDIKKYVRSNNVARFKVSASDHQAKFH